MAWVQAFPTAARLISQSVNQIQANWQFLELNINTDHFFNNVPEGRHRQVTMPNRAGGNPGALPANTNAILYTLAGRIKGYDGTASFFMPPLVASVVFNNVGGISGTSTNVNNIVKNGVGDFTINFLANIPSTNGPWTASAFSNNIGQLLVCGLTQYTVASVRVLVKDAATGANTDPVLASFMIYYGY